MHVVLSMIVINNVCSLHVINLLMTFAKFRQKTNSNNKFEILYLHRNEWFSWLFYKIQKNLKKNKKKRKFNQINILFFILLYNYVSLYVYFLLFLTLTKFICILLFRFRILQTSTSNKNYWFIYSFIYEYRLFNLRF